jgi:cilia- and flagella-associated protein 57
LKKLDGYPKLPITSFCIQGEHIVYTTQNKQLLKMKHHAEKPDDIGKFSYLISPFHSEAITGIQTCLKRQILLTAGKDRTLRVWNYYSTSASNTISLSICEPTFDEVLALALHPTGNYFVAAFNALARCYNIFPKQVKAYHDLPIKSCKEMKFSQFGNLLACQDGKRIVVINFFSGVLPENYVF